MNERRKLDISEFGAICGDADVAEIFRVHPDWVELWEKKGHLPSLGGRTKGCQRYYATKVIFQLRDDVEWLDKAIKLVRQHFRQKNGGSKA